MKDDMEATDGSATRILQEVLKLSNKLIAPFSTYLERQHKISLNEFRLLMLIGRFPALASHELADMTGVNPMSVSRAVAALVKHGRVVVVRDNANRRRKTIMLSDKGQKLFDVMQPQTEKVANYFVSALEPEELKQFSTMIGKLTDALEAEDEQGRSLFMEHTRPVEVATPRGKGVARSA
jgi:DNA-binding MarR family transcriptional regulator